MVIITPRKSVNEDEIFQRIVCAPTIAKKLECARSLFAEDSPFNYGNRQFSAPNAATEADAIRLIEQFIGCLAQTSSFTVLADPERTLPGLLPPSFEEVRDFMLAHVGLEPTEVYPSTDLQHEFSAFFNRLGAKIYLPLDKEKHDPGNWLEKACAWANNQDQTEECTLSSKPSPTVLFIDYGEESPALATAMSIGTSRAYFRFSEQTTVEKDVNGEIYLHAIDICVCLPLYYEGLLNDHFDLANRVKDVYDTFISWHSASMHVQRDGRVTAVGLL